jgi:hypothetical protein
MQNPFWIGNKGVRPTRLPTRLSHGEREFFANPMSQPLSSFIAFPVHGKPCYRLKGSYRRIAVETVLSLQHSNFEGASFPTYPSKTQSRSGSRRYATTGGLQLRGCIATSLSPPRRKTPPFRAGRKSMAIRNIVWNVAFAKTCPTRRAHEGGRAYLTLSAF